MKNLTHRVRQRIVRHRIERGWTPSGLARRAGVHRSFVLRFEADMNLGLSVETLGNIANALGVKVSELVADEDESLRSSGPSPPIGDCVQLRDLCTISRGVELPAGFIQALWPGESGYECASERERRRETKLRSKVFEIMKTRMLRAVATAGGIWPSLATAETIDVRQCYTLADLRAFVPCEGSAGVLHIDGLPQVFKDATVFRPPVKIVLEPRTLLAAVDMSRTAVPQTLIALVPYGKTRTERMMVARRLTAALNTLDPFVLAPDVRWHERSYRPRVRQIAALRMAKTITSSNDPAWVKVDKLNEKVVNAMADKKQDAIQVTDTFAYCQDQRMRFPYRDDLADAIGRAMSTS